MTNQSAKLREGYTTGSTATAAAMAALRHLLGHEVPARIKIPLPVKGTLEIPVEKVEMIDDWSRAVVVKDGGDDPDATHGEEIHALVRIHADSDADSPGAVVWRFGIHVSTGLQKDAVLKMQPFCIDGLCLLIRRFIC